MYADILLESMNIDPIGDMFNDPDFFFMEESNIENEYVESLMELTEGVNVGNFFEKAWNFIKKIFGFLIKQAQRFARWIALLFKKKTKTIDDILIDLGVNVVKNKKTGKVKLLIDERSEMAGMEDIEAITKPFFVQFAADSQRVFISYKEAKAAYRSAIFDIAKNTIFGKNDVDENTNGKIKGFGAPLPVNARFDLVFKIIIERPYQDHITKFVKTILQNNTEMADATYKEFKSFIDDVNNANIKIKDRKISFSLQQLMDFQKWLNETFNLISEVGQPDNSKYPNDQNIVNLINEFLEFCNNLQMGMNIISNAIKQIYLIDIDWLESIDDITVLGKFVDSMIQSGVPPKFIMFNSILAASKKLKGDADHNKPVCGQTRAILFPYDKKIVYKIAVSQMGILSNKAEYDLYKKLSAAGIGDLFAATYDHSESFSVISGERVDTSRKCTIADANAMKKKVVEVTDKIGLPIGIDHDIHFKNIGYRGNQMVVLDYGNNTRRYLDSPRKSKKEEPKK